MTKLYFIWKNIIYSFLTEKNLTLLILFGMMISDVIFFVFGNAFWSGARAEEYQAYRNNVVVFQFDSLDIEAFLKRTGSRDYITSTFFEHTVLDESGAPLKIAAYSPASGLLNAGIRLGSSLSGSPMEFAVNDSYIRAHSGSALSALRPGDRFRILDGDWTLAGILSVSAADSFDILINLEDFRSRIREKITAGFRFRSGTSLLELQEFSDELRAEFQAVHVAAPSGPVRTGYGEFLSDMGGALLLLSAAVVNYMFLYRFLLTKRTYLYGIYKACGMSNFYTVCMLCAELSVMLVISYLPAMLLYSGGLFLAGRAGSPAEHGTEFVFAFFTVAALNLLFGGIAAAKLIRNSPVKLMKESVVT